MIKKIFVMITILCLLISKIVYAGDEPESIMDGNQKAFFIGKITDIGTNTYNIIPITVMMGNIQHKEIIVQRFYKYYGNNDEPKVDDFIVAKLLDENKVDTDWIFKCTSDDYKTLKLVSKPFDIVERYEKYINEGKYFEAEKKIVDNTEIQSSTNISSLTNVDKINSNVNQDFVFIKVFVSIVIIILVLTYLYKVKFKKIKN